MTIKKHVHILLSENASGTVGYCETCHVVELEFSAISLRLDEQSLEMLSTLLKDAQFRLNVYLTEKQKFTPKQPTDLMFH
jgi:hypothetical protein